MTGRLGLCPLGKDTSSRQDETLLVIIEVITPINGQGKNSIPMGIVFVFSHLNSGVFICHLYGLQLYLHL